MQDRRQAIVFAKRPVKFWDAGPKEFSKNSLKRYLSAEIECDKIDSSADGSMFRKTIKKWNDSIVKDGSLHGDYAHEANMAPSNGDLFINHVKEITDGYEEIGASCSDACGLHVHVDAADLTFYDLRKVIILYRRVEKALFELCAHHRVNARYSLVCGENYSNMEPNPEDFKRQLFGRFYRGGELVSLRPDKKMGDAIKKAKAYKYGEARYRALNIHSFFLRKTLEFRHHEGTVDFETITNWAMICGHVVEMANKLSEAQILALPKDSKEALLAILPSDLQKHAKKTWKRRGSFDWDRIQEADNLAADLPNIPAEERNLDRKSMRKKIKAERKAKAKVKLLRLQALRAIVAGTTLDGAAIAQQQQAAQQATQATQQRAQAEPPSVLRPTIGEHS